MEKLKEFKGLRKKMDNSMNMILEDGGDIEVKLTKETMDDLLDKMDKLTRIEKSLI